MAEYRGLVRMKRRGGYLRAVGIMGILGAGQGGLLDSRCMGQGSAAAVSSSVSEPKASEPKAQEEGRNSIVHWFTEAREAYQKQDWRNAAERFRRVSQACVGSPLALESNYFAMIADWKQRDAACWARITSWLDEAKAYQNRAAGIGGTSPKSMDAWISHAHLLCAQHERRALDHASAENRLRALLELQGGERHSQFPWPNRLANPAAVWLELGLLLSESKRDWQEVKHCMQQALELSGGSDEFRCLALTTLARCHLELGEIEEGEKALEQLERFAVSDSWRVRAALLRSQLEKTRNDLAQAGKALRPAVEIALAGRTEYLLLYELAIALLEAGDGDNSDLLLLELVRRDPTNPIAVEARVRLARRESSQYQWRNAREYLDEAIALGCPPHLVAHAHLARGETFLSLQLPNEARDDLVIALRHVGDDLVLDTSVRFLLAESLVQLELWEDAKPHWDVLIQRAEQTGGALPEWLAILWLRQAELLALKRDWRGAEELVSRIHTKFPECDRRDEVDYVLARCLISQARFDQARQLLVAIASNPQARFPELVARSWWMTGETYLMQQRYADALRSYERVLGAGAGPYWQSAAWMQIGQCHELLRDVASARSAYQQILDRDAEGVFGTSAVARMAALSRAAARESLQPSARTSNDVLGSDKR